MALELEPLKLTNLCEVFVALEIDQACSTRARKKLDSSQFPPNLNVADNIKMGVECVISLFTL